MHVHTSEVSRCAHSTSEEIMNDYKKTGFTGVVITDHFGDPSYLNGYGDIPWSEKVDIFLKGYYGAKKIGDALGIDVFLGVELRLIPKMEILIYGMDEDFLKRHEGIQNLSLEELYQLVVVENNLLMFQPHPFRTNEVLGDTRFLSGVEVINGGKPEDINRLGYDHAVKNKTPMIAGSDNHRKGADKCGLMTNTKITSQEGLLQMLKSNDYKIFCGMPYSDDHPMWSNPQFIKTKRQLLE